MALDFVRYDDREVDHLQHGLHTFFNTNENDPHMTQPTAEQSQSS
jgi:hypothetical protein